MEKHTNQTFSSHLVMVRPFKFYCNQETLLDNIYQSKITQNQQIIHNRAIQQFDSFVSKLRENHIKVTVVQDDGRNKTPDSIYPNNWVSFHYQNQALLYPMYASNRRKERQIPLIQELQKQLNRKVNIIHDYTSYQDDGVFLEGTGSMVLDRQNKIAYAVISHRTHQKLFSKFCTDMGFKGCFFHATQYSIQKNMQVPIYHTNVLLSISKKFIMLGQELISDKEQKQKVRQMIMNYSGKELIELSGEQIRKFAGNALTVQNTKGQYYLIISSTGYKSLNQDQISKIQESVKIIYTDLQTIQQNGGGSARCMLAEVF